jgi:two-component system cell cycle response regulator
MLFDLNGFKAYNDAFGHAAGDDLLSRLGRALRAAMAPRGIAYRLGGDEFCVLAPVDARGTEPWIIDATGALTERGSGFEIDASYGTILLPLETHDPVEALRLADQRMYAQKRGNRRSADRQSKDVLLRALHERNPHLHRQLDDITDLVAAVAARMGLSPEETEQAVQAAELHDVGQVAIPDAILTKHPGLLDDDEAAFLRSQPVIAERIIGAAPALTQVAKLVRSTREHFDGTGYPDHLAGQRIPLGSRIVAACHEYVTLTTDSHHGPATSPDEALRELRRRAGTRFDPQVISMLMATITEPQAAAHQS